MKKTYRLILESINGKTKEITVVLDKKLIRKQPAGYAENSVVPNYVKPTSNRKNPVA